MTGMFKVTTKVDLKDQMHVCLRELLPLLGDMKKLFGIYSKNKIRSNKLVK